MNVSAMPGFAEVWRRITALEGSVFREIRGGEFTLSIEGKS